MHSGLVGSPRQNLSTAWGRQYSVASQMALHLVALSYHWEEAVWYNLLALLLITIMALKLLWIMDKKRDYDTIHDAIYKYVQIILPQVC